MSLLRLLTTGKSLVGVKDTESRYRVTSERLLPQFGSAKNPFSSTESRMCDGQAGNCPPDMQRDKSAGVRPGRKREAPSAAPGQKRERAR